MNNLDTERSKTEQQPKKSLSKKLSVLKKIDSESAKALLQFKERANRKSFGRKVRDADILALAIKQLSPEHIKELQEQTLTEKDRLHLAHQEYVDKNGKIGLDQFIGKLIRGELTKN